MKLGIQGYLVFITVFAFTAISCSAPDPTLIEVEGGLIKGTSENGLSIFKGIPFAAPPVGELRWQAPQPVIAWEGIKQTTEFAPSPYQGGNPPSGKSEDCLYLNIWSPAKSREEKLPVLVWIYGGGFSFGSTAIPVHDGTNLAKKGVILVSLAYRVGPLGFIAHPQLSAENPNNVSGNYGLLDQIAALEWIQENISHFGGNPDQVTIFGESAGGIAVSMLCASPLAQGLFDAAISQSGGSFGPTRPTTYPGENMKTLAQAESDGQKYFERNGVSSIQELRNIPPEELPMGMGIEGGWPIVDGYVIPDVQTRLYQEGNYNDVPVMIGYNSDEGASFLRVKEPEAYIERVKERYGPFADTLLQAYPPGEKVVAKTARDLSRDAAFGWQTWKWGILQSRTGKQNVYYYYFDQHLDYPEDSPRYGYGSPHGQDVAYAFMNLDSANERTTPGDLKLQEIMGTYWTNFAKYGDPNGENLTKWPVFNEDNPDVLYLMTEPIVGPVPDEPSMKVLDAYFQWRMTPEGDAWAK